MLNHRFRGGITQRDIARTWKPAPIEQASVNEHVKKGGWDSVDETLTQFTQLVGWLRTDLEDG